MYSLLNIQTKRSAIGKQMTTQWGQKQLGVMGSEADSTSTLRNKKHCQKAK